MKFKKPNEAKNNVAIESNTASNDILKDIKEQVTNMVNNPFLEDIKKTKIVLKRKGAMKSHSSAMRQNKHMKP